MNWNQNSSMVWDWGNLSPVCPSAIEESFKSGSPLKPTDACAGVGDTRDGSVSSSDVTFTSSLELGHGSSKSSMSASTGSPFKQGKALEFNFQSVSSEIDRVEDSGTSMAICHGEPLISLKLGKGTYFEKGFEGEDVKNCATTGRTSSLIVVKKTKVSQKSRDSYCQVEGCNVDLSSAKDYHRKHKVCEAHSKAPKVVVAGLERRFCQQCSRLHGLAEFDQNKRSCRRRLSHHNARRRKPQTDAVSFSSSRLSTMLYNDSRRQTNLFALSSWDKLQGFRFDETKFPLVKPTKIAGFDETHFSTYQISNTDVAHAHHNLHEHMSVKGTNINVFNQGAETSAITCNVNRAPVAGRALSLLSNDSWASNPTVIQQSSSHVQAGSMQPLIAANPVMPELDSTAGGFRQDAPPLDGASHLQAFGIGTPLNMVQYAEDSSPGTAGQSFYGHQQFAL